MTTITVYCNGVAVGRCDARCHEAKNAECNCICGGAYHGVGTKAAIEDRFDLSAEEILKDLDILPPGGKMVVERSPEQKKLFDEKNICVTDVGGPRQ